MMGVNKIFLIGNLGKDPEVRTAANGGKYAKFTLAVSRRFTDKEGKTREDTEWFNVTCFARLAEVAEQYLRKGRLIYLEGRVHSSKYQDRDNQERVWTEVIVDQFTMLPEGRRDAVAAGAPLPKGNGSAAIDADIPF